jgi:hypothetical protein
MTKLCPLEPKSLLLLYLSASNLAVSAVLVQEKEEGKLKQISVYFASEALSGSKLFYSELEKIAYAVVMAARKLRHYFEGHKIRVITNQPLNDLFANKRSIHPNHQVGCTHWHKGSSRQGDKARILLAIHKR